MSNCDFGFFGIVSSDNINLFLEYYLKYDKRHIRVKHKDRKLYTTLFNIQIEKSMKNEILIFGVSSERLSDSFVLNKEYSLVFDTDITILGKIKFIEY